MTELLKKLADGVDENGAPPTRGGKSKPPEKNGKPKPPAGKSEPEENGENGEQKPGAPGAPSAENPAEASEAVPGEGAPASQAAVNPTAIIEFFAANPNPDDAAFHSFAEQNGFDTHQAETVAYAIATKFINFLKGGRYNEKQLDVGSVDPDQLSQGIEVEYEHTPDPEVAKKIALDHLAEFPDYYTRLAMMEQQAKEEAGAAAVPKDNLNDQYAEGNETPGSGEAPSSAPTKTIAEDGMADKSQQY